MNANARDCTTSYSSQRKGRMNMETALKIWNGTINFFNHPFFGIIGGLTTVIAIAGLLYTVVLIIRGLIPVWYRLGMGLAKRKIAVFSKNEFENLSGMLIDSRLFKSKNIIRIERESIKKGETATLLLVHWKEFKDRIDEILKIKRDSSALIIYAPKNEGAIDDKNMERINAERNAIVVNFRGRLLNDILTSMITTSYAER